MGAPIVGIDANAEPVHSASILIVDDTPANLRLLTQMLTERGYYTRPVLNGVQALAAAQIMPPDLILLDIRMPEMDGYEVCRQLKADVRTSAIPVLFISALSDTEDKLRAFTAGGLDYITKPFQLEEVLARVETQLTVRRLQMHLQQEIAERDSLIADLKAYAHTVAHDLRSPLAGALGAAQILAGATGAVGEEERAEFAGLMVETLQKANNIVKELLLLAEVRQAEVRVEPLAMDAVTAAALARVADLLRAAGATVTQPPAWPCALGYPAWIEEVWVNYLTNAIKYGGSPPVIALGAAVEGDGYIRCWVRDNGAGLTPEQQALLFAPFTRLDQTRATGHGLGLSITQRIVAKLNGRVGVVSSGNPGEGCTFFFALPPAPAA
jgi:two-component system sensor histidine kinase/response regulator